MPPRTWIGGNAVECAAAYIAETRHSSGQCPSPQPGQSSVSPVGRSRASTNRQGFRVCSARGRARSASFEGRHNQRTYPRVGARREHLIGSPTDVCSWRLVNMSPTLTRTGVRLLAAGCRAAFQRTPPVAHRDVGRLHTSSVVARAVNGDVWPWLRETRHRPRLWSARSRAYSVTALADQ